MPQMDIGLEMEIRAVQGLGEEIGYGHLMSLASALWRKHLKETGCSETGAFVPTIIPWITEEGAKVAEKSAKIYDTLIKENEKK